MGVARYGEEGWMGIWTPTSLVVFLCSGISIGNALELILLVLVTFQTRKGLYFWSLLLTSISVLPYTVGGLISYVEVRPRLLGDVMNNLGWAVMITGQSVVLYSRLGILLRKRKVLRAVLVMIVIDGVVFYFTTTIVHYGTYSKEGNFKKAMYYIEKIQMTGFTLQELIISGLYVREVVKASKFITHIKFRRTLWELLVINVVIIVLDIALLALEYLGFSILEQTFKALAYSYKLKMEFAILGKLVAMAQPLSSRQEKLENETEDTCITNRKHSQGAWQLQGSEKISKDSSDVMVSTSLRQDSHGAILHSGQSRHHTQISVDISAIPREKESVFAQRILPDAEKSSSSETSTKERMLSWFEAVQRQWPLKLRRAAEYRQPRSRWKQALPAAEGQQC